MACKENITWGFLEIQREALGHGWWRLSCDPHLVNVGVQTTFTYWRKFNKAIMTLFSQYSHLKHGVYLNHKSIAGYNTSTNTCARHRVVVLTTAMFRTLLPVRREEHWQYPNPTLSWRIEVRQCSERGIFVLGYFHKQVWIQESD